MIGQTADRPADPATLSPTLSRAIDNVLVAHHTLRASLKLGHPPLGEAGPDGMWHPAPLSVGLAHYGAESPLLGLWLECVAVEALRVVWTGRTDA
jgi:hypothetical protein